MLAYDTRVQLIWNALAQNQLCIENALTGMAIKNVMEYVLLDTLNMLSNRDNKKKYKKKI